MLQVSSLPVGCREDGEERSVNVTLPLVERGEVTGWEAVEDTHWTLSELLSLLTDRSVDTSVV